MGKKKEDSLSDQRAAATAATAREGVHKRAFSLHISFSS
jgi:hypothetical protein